MPYCTIDDITEQLPNEELLGLTDDDDLGAVDTAKVARAIADADAEIDSYCGRGNYQLPFLPVPEIIRKRSVDIAIYNLYARRRGAPEDRKQRYADAIVWLRGVSSGLVTLGVEDPSGNPPDGGLPEFSTDRRVFGGGGF
ncbi:MAG: DUF1320 domain-containing protein [Thermodesulfobacteriota bacterium]